MSKIISTFFLAIILTFSLSWANKAMAQGDTEVQMTTLSFADLGLDDITNPCDGSVITTQGSIQFTLIEAVANDGNHILEQFHFNGSGLGTDENNNDYMIKLSEQINNAISESCSENFCGAAAAVGRSKTGQNFVVNAVIQIDANGNITMNKLSATCQATGPVPIE